MGGYDLEMGLCVIKVLCLIVIAMAVTKMASQSSYEGMTGEDPRYVEILGAQAAQDGSRFMGDGQYERPMFWNIGDISATDEVLQGGSRAKESDEAVYALNAEAKAQYDAGLAAARAQMVQTLVSKGMSQADAAAQVSSTSGMANPWAKFDKVQYFESMAGSGM